jgi:hypothetical protein
MKIFYIVLFSFWQEALKAKDDNGQFYYCLPKKRHNPRARYDPYDLQVVSANTARKHTLYWTVSATSITMVYFFFI